MYYSGISQLSTSTFGLRKSTYRPELPNRFETPILEEEKGGEKDISIFGAAASGPSRTRETKGLIRSSTLALK